MFRTMGFRGCLAVLVLTATGLLGSAASALGQAVTSESGGGEAVAVCTGNTGTVKLSPGLTKTAAVQTVKIKGTLSGCTGEPFTAVAYSATLTTTGPVSCSVLTEAGEPAAGAAKFKWTPKTKPSSGTGTLGLALTETPDAAFSGAVSSGAYSPLTFSGGVSLTFTGGSTCGVPPLGKTKPKPVKTGTLRPGTADTIVQR